MRVARFLERDRILCFPFSFFFSFGKVKEKHGITMFMTGIMTYY